MAIKKKTTTKRSTARKTVVRAKRAPLTAGKRKTTARKTTARKSVVGAKKSSLTVSRSVRKKAPLAKRRSTRKAVVKAEKTTKLGSGSRFKALASSAKASGAKNPRAVAAAAGRKKYGQKKMTKLSVAGRSKG